MIRDYFSLSIKSLRRRKLRSWLTIIGIFIGIASIVAFITLGQGLENYVNEQFEQVGSDKILIQAKTIGPPGSTTNPALLLTKKDLETIGSVRGVENAAGALVRTAPVRFKDEIEVVMVDGISEEYLEIFADIDSLKVIEGRQLKDSDKFKLVVGYNHVFGELWQKKAKIGNDLEIEGKKFEIIGVIKKQGNPYDDAAVWLTKDVFVELFNTGDDEGTIMAKTKKGFNPESVAEDIKRKLRRERDEKEGQETFTVQTFSQLLGTFMSILGVVQAVFIGIAAISLIVGGIGIMNTMYTSVLERTKEIGTMKAIGARNSDVLLIFLIESGLIGLIGGVIGLALGMGISKAIEYVIVNFYGITLLKIVFNPTTILSVLLFSFVIGSASGVLPALQASKLKPVDALRYE